MPAARRLLSVLACAALLPACATLPPPGGAGGADASGSHATAAGFALEGRLSVRQGEMRHHVGISWRHEPDRDAIFLTGPLGQGLAELTRDETGARLLTADRRLQTAPDWEGLAERALGARLPFSNLPQWLAAVPPAPTFQVDGWRIDVLETDDGRPTLIELRRDDIEARLKIDQWLR